MTQDLPAVLLILVLAGAGLGGANALVDRGLPASVSRYLAPVLVGLAFLAAVLWLDALTAIVLSGSLTAFIAALRARFRDSLRGVKGALDGQAWAEVTFALAGTAGLALGWGLLGDRWLAFTAIAFMAWGDSAAGLARATIWRGRETGPAPSLAMFGVCLAIAGLLQPYAVATAGALVAAGVERFRLGFHKAWDDNWLVVTAPLGAMALLSGAVP